MSNRLTNKMREDMIELLITRTFNDRRQAMKNKNAKLFEELIRAAWGEYFVHIEAIPVGMLHAYSSFSVWVRGDEKLNILFAGHYPMPIPCRFSIHWNEDDFESLPKSARDAIRTHAAENDALCVEISVARTKLRNATYGVSSLKKLYELWPELGTVPGVESSGSAPTGKQLAVSREELNAIFGLPVGE